jgi:hypothetical protein
MKPSNYWHKYYLQVVLSHFTTLYCNNNNVFYTRITNLARILKIICTISDSTSFDSPVPGHCDSSNEYTVWQIEKILYHMRLSEHNKHTTFDSQLLLQ